MPTSLRSTVTAVLAVSFTTVLFAPVVACGNEKRARECAARCEAESQDCAKRKEKDCVERARRCGEECAR